MALPKFIFVKSDSNNKYLCYAKEDGPYHARLRFSFVEEDEKPEFRCVKFEVEESTVEGMVHIRNCYNNKYLVRKSADSNLIVGEANEAEEDQSKWSCTLFKPVFVDLTDEDGFVPHDEPRKIRLLHIDQLIEHHTCMSNTQGGDDDTFDLVVGNQDARSSADGDVFTVYDAKSAVVLPLHIAFMGHNDQYCAITYVKGIPYLEFKTQDIGASGVLNYARADLHDVRIVNGLTNRHWMASASSLYIIPDFNGLLAGNLGAFRPTRLGGNEIALFSLQNNRFANCGSGLGMAHMLGATATSISEDAKLRVVEPVFIREVKNLVYNIDDTRLYNVGEIRVFNDSRSNGTSVEQTGSISVSYKKTHTTSWSDSVSVTTGVKGSWSFSIPYVGEFGVELSTEQTQTREWGEETTEEETNEYVQNVNIPPLKRVVVRVVATRASCDIPFTCEVSDTLTNGEIYKYTKLDGLFTGTNAYNYSTVIFSEDLVTIPLDASH